MSNTWDPDYTIDEALVRRLLQRHAHQLDLSTLRPLSSGWFHVVWCTESYVFRFPVHTHGSFAAHTVEELSTLADSLPLAIPRPAWIGEPVEGYGETYVAYAKIEGELPASLSLTYEDRCRTARPLARFLRTLHAQPIPASLAELRPHQLAIRTERAAGRAQQLAGTHYAEIAQRAAAEMEANTPAESTRLALTHGDLHWNQLLFNENHDLVGILDWDSLGAGDPAADLALAYSLLPPDARSTFFAEYGTREGWQRARHMALSWGLALLAQATADGREALAIESATALRHALT